MPFRKLKVLPGVNLEASQTLNQTQFAQTNLCRFYGGLIQKIGGWQQLSAATFIGICRGLHGWADIIGNPYLAIGTEQRLSVMIGGAISDITPIVQTSNITPAFSTTAGTLSVTIEDNTYSPSAGDWVNLTTQVAVGGVVLSGYYQVVSSSSPNFVVSIPTVATSTVASGGVVPTYITANGSSTVTVALPDHGLTAGSIFDAQVSTTVATIVIFGMYSVVSVVDANQFTISGSTTANATTFAPENGGDVQIEYLLPSGLAVNTFGVGYGVGPYGSGPYGQSSSAQTVEKLRQWSLDHFGQDLIASPTNGGIYYWMPPTVAPALVVSSTAPTANTAVFVMSQAQIIIALGAETGGTQEPLLVRWCDAGDFTDWVPTAINQAGSFFIPNGTRLVGGLAVGLGALVWTDDDLWTMAYLGPELVFGFNSVAVGCGLLAQRAMGSVGPMVMWLSSRGFFQYAFGGGVTPMECSVWDFIFTNLDQTQVDQVQCAVNSLFNEMAWFFPISPTSPIYSASAPLGYVKFNYIENAWDYGQSSQYQRTAWIGKSPIGNPLGSDYEGLIQQHEVGFDANGAGMIWSWQTGFFDLSEGEDFVFADLLIPDNVTIGNPVINYTILSTYTPNQTITQTGPFAVTNSTAFVPFRARGRQMAIAASGSDLGTFNRLGALRYRYAPDGRN